VENGNRQKRKNVPKNSKLLGALENWYLFGMGINEKDAREFES
jgi:hypothetical protein